MEIKSSFILYLDQEQVFRELPLEKSGELLLGIFQYIRTGEEPKFNDFLKYVFIPIQQKLDKDKEKYKIKCLKNKENVEKRWNEENTNVYERIRSNTKHTDKTHYHISYINNILLNNILNNYILIKKKYFKNILLEETFNKYLKMRIEKKCRATETTIQSIIKKLNRYDVKTAISMLNYSIDNGYQGVFEPKDNLKKDKPQKELPEWFDKNIENEVNIEATKEMDDLLEKFN